MKTAWTGAAVVACALTLMSGCGGEEEATTDATDVAAAGPIALLDEQGEPVEVVPEQAEEAEAAPMPAATPRATADLKTLKALLPESIAGFERTDASAEKTSVGDFTMAQADGTYEQGDASIDISVVDLGSGNSEFAQGMAAWSQIELEHETETGYERTTTYKGMPAFERFDADGGSGDYQVFVGGRFMVTIDGYGVTEEQLAAARDAVDFDAIKAVE